MSAPVSNFAIEDDAFNLRDALDRILETLVSVYESYNVPLPTRRYWTFGQPALDCEQAVVSFVQMYLGQPGDEATEPRHCDQPRSVVVSVDVTREVPSVNPNSGKAPTAAQIQKASEWQAIDAWVLMESMQQFDQWGGFGRGLGVVATVNASPAEGGLANVTLNLVVAVP